MTQPSAVSTFSGRSAIAVDGYPSAGAVNGGGADRPSVDWLEAIESLAFECTVVCEGLGRHPARWREVEALRQCARELALLVDACGGEAISVSRASPSSKGGLLQLLGRFRLATEIPMPRALREALRSQLQRLEHLTSAAVDSARAA